ncbi:MAG: hypothetical protein IPM38_13085 [Ignavibacteria bacterium]|nr:hypothetical protein [Ignavibacteria bacterium]
MNRYIIEKQFIEIEMQGKVDAFSFKDQLMDICTNKLIPGIEKLFDNKIPGDRIIRIDKLEIDAGNVSFENWENRFVESVIKNLSQYIDEIETDSFGNEESNNEKYINKEKKDSESILYFLEKGFLPWHSDTDSRNALQLILEELLSNDDERFKKDLKELLRKNRDALKRLVLQFDKDKLELIQKKLFHEINADKITEIWRKILSQVNISYEQQKENIYLALFSVRLSDGSPISETTLIHNISEEIMRLLKPEFISKLTEILGQHDNNDIEKIVHETLLQFSEPEIKIREVKKERPEEKPDHENYEWYISNSGLVILHPFLLKLFENTGYIENKEWIGNEQQQRAIALLQYAVTGAEEYPEFLLMLNKIICGYDISDSLPAEILLSEFEKNEADELLKSVIGHWTALKNTSVPGLRETFLMRDGKLSRDDEGWLLQCEVKTVDILINKLPWGMSMIKLPWMKEMLRVEWNY